MLNSNKTKEKKKYTAPQIEFEYYKLDANIASNCAIVVSNGPQLGKHEQCSDYEDVFGMYSSTYSLRGNYNVHFYEDTNCECYNSSVFGYWTS